MFDSIIEKIVDNIVLPIITFLGVLAILLFVWGLMGFFFGGEDKRDQSKNHILWGTVGLFIMISVYGIIRLVAATVGQQGTIGF